MFTPVEKKVNVTVKVMFPETKAVVPSMKNLKVNFLYL